MQIKKIELEGWNVDLVVDEDSHLNIYIKHNDGSQVHACDADIGSDDEWGERFTTEKIEEAYTKSIPTFKRMTREEVIAELVQVEEHRRFFYECDPENLMRFGFKGYNDYTDQELLEEYTETFEEDLKGENLQVEIVSAECKKGSVQKKG